MASPRPPSLAQAHHYRLPELLHDIRLLDLLELCGTTVQTSRLVQLSQPTISRRYRLLSEDFGLVRDRRQLWGCGYGTSAAMRLLRLGCRAHRLAAGVARIGSDLLHHPLLAGCPWLLPTPQRFRAAANHPRRPKPPSPSAWPPTVWSPLTTPRWTAGGTVKCPSCGRGSRT